MLLPGKASLLSIQGVVSPTSTTSRVPVPKMRALDDLDRAAVTSTFKSGALLLTWRDVSADAAQDDEVNKPLSDNVNEGSHALFYHAASKVGRFLPKTP